LIIALYNAFNRFQSGTSINDIKILANGMLPTIIKTKVFFPAYINAIFIAIGNFDTTMLEIYFFNYEQL